MTIGKGRYRGKDDDVHLRPYARAPVPLALFAIAIAAALTMRECWHLRAAAARNADFDIFARNIVIGGGLLMLMGMGSGCFAISKPAGGENPPAPAPKRR
jgi:hypothetical protein